jgi:hypothetical protein
MSSHYLKQMTPRIVRCTKRLIELWDAKQTYLKQQRTSSKRWSTAFDASPDINFYTVVTFRADLTCHFVLTQALRIP